MKLLSLIPRAEHGSGSREIEPHQLARMRPHPLVIDAREERDFLLGHIEGAIHVSRKALENKMSEIAPKLDTPIVIYCAVGTSCASAVEGLRQQGYQRVFSLKGGLQSWLEAGGLVESSQSRQNLRGAFSRA
jgi:rhodanese-related sulfurtransferase